MLRSLYAIKSLVIEEKKKKIDIRCCGRLLVVGKKMMSIVGPNKTSKSLPYQLMWKILSNFLSIAHSYHLISCFSHFKGNVYCLDITLTSYFLHTQTHKKKKNTPEDNLFLWGIYFFTNNSMNSYSVWNSHCSIPKPKFFLSKLKCFLCKLIICDKSGLVQKRKRKKGCHIDSERF